MQEVFEKLSELDAWGVQSSIDEVLSKLKLDDHNQTVGNMSGGQKRRLAMAKIFIEDPDIIILDEPMVGLDPNATSEMRELIKDLKKDHTVILSSHQLHEVSLICDDITIINDGRILRSGSVESISHEINKGQVLELEVDSFNDDLERKVLKAFNVQVESRMLDNSDKSTFLRLSYQMKAYCILIQ